MHSSKCCTGGKIAQVNGRLYIGKHKFRRGFCAHTNGWAVDGRRVFEKKSDALLGSIKKCQVSGNKATYLLSAAANGTEAMTLQAEFSFDTFNDSATITYVKFTNKLNGQTFENYSYGDAYSYGVNIGIFIELYRLLFDIEAVNKALQR